MSEKVKKNCKKLKCPARKVPTPPQQTFGKLRKLVAP